MRRKIASHYALINSRLERDIIVEVDDSGMVTAIEHCTSIDSHHGVEFHPGILIPGMVNAHCHLELSYLRGAIAEGEGFAGFARAIGRVRGNYSDKERIEAATTADRQMWEEGVQAVADIANDDLIMGVKEQSPIEYHTMFELFGLNNNNIDGLRAMASLYSHASVTPHSTYSINDAPFRAIASSSRTPLSIHFLESDDESKLYHQQGSLWEWYERMGWKCDFLHYGSPARRIVGSVAKECHLLLVHATRVTPEDIATIKCHFTTQPTWVLCPESNRYISRLTPPTKELRDMGCNIAIGTDSLASAHTVSMVDNMRQLSNMALTELLVSATLNGARALGIDDRLGSIAVGRRPGLVVIRDADLQQLRLTPEAYAQRLI